MLRCRELLNSFKDDPPPNEQAADLGFKLLQGTALVEIAEILNHIEAGLNRLNIDIGEDAENIDQGIAMLGTELACISIAIKER